MKFEREMLLSAKELEFLKKIKAHLEDGRPASTIELEDEDQEGYMKEYNLLTYKPVIYAANVSEEDLADDAKSNPHVQKVREYAEETGSEVFALGYPMADVMGTEVKFTDGKISSKSGIQGDVRVYQISVPIQPGNSGGPLFNMEGNVVGITSSGLNRDYFKSENVNYAIKASYLKSLIEACPQEIAIGEGVKNLVVKSSLTDRIKQYEDFIVLILTK